MDDLYSKYCRVNHCIFELISSINDLPSTERPAEQIALSELEDRVLERLEQIENE
jgi:hypothetical protein